MKCEWHACENNLPEPRNPRQRFCSSKCVGRSSDQKRKRRLNWETRPCEICGKKFRKRPGAKTCSQKCSGAFSTVSSRAKAVGITAREFRLLQSVDLCSICLRRREDAPRGVLQIDHDHELGHVREPICGQCNTILGMCYDNITILEACIAYLKYWGKMPRGFAVREYVYPDNLTE